MIEDAVPDTRSYSVDEQVPDFLYSTLREKLLEHVFVADLLRCLWRRGFRDMEVLRAEVDYGGYDLVFESQAVMRHVQLKSSRLSAKRRAVDININLAKKPGGCVVWIMFDPETLQLGPFYWLGGEPGERLPELGVRLAKHTRGDKKDRPGLRVVSRKAFRQLSTIDEVATVLFGTVGQVLADKLESDREG